MHTKEDETRQIGVVIQVRDINVLIRHYSNEGNTDAVQKLQDSRIAHGLEPLVIEEEKDGKTLATVSNEQPDQGDA